MIRPLRLALLAAVVLVIPQAAPAALLSYTAVLSGPNEAPPNTSPATGTAQVDIDTDLNTMRVRAQFGGLLGTTTMAHIHAATATPGTGTALVATTPPAFPNFPLGVTSGVYDQLLDMTASSSYNPAFITANGGTVESARSALFSSIAAGTSYFNIHTTSFGGGEIRGFFQPAVVPEPSSLILMGTGAFGLFVVARRKSAKV